MLTDRLHADGFWPESEYRDRVTRFMRIDEGSERGHVGDPTVASAEKSERMLSAIVDSLIEVVEDILADRLWSRLIEPSAGFARGELRRSL